MTTDNNIHIAGSGAIAGGDYGKVIVSGSGRITGAITCETLRVSGTVTCDGPVSAHEIKVSGTAVFQDRVTVESASVSGTSSFRRLEARRLKVSGSTDVDETLTGGTIDVTGGLRVGQDCEVERFLAVGGFNIGGLLSADTVDVRMHAACRAGEVGGESIEFREGRGFWHDIATALGLPGTRGLEAGSVEGDHILLEHAKVGTVRGRDVELGPDCEVDLVEYDAELKQAKSAKVKAARKVEAAATPQA